MGTFASALWGHVSGKLLKNRGGSFRLMGKPTDVPFEFECEKCRFSNSVAKHCQILRIVIFVRFMKQ
jgi:hypothetical protein